MALPASSLTLLVVVSLRAESACLLPAPKPPMKYVGSGGYFSPVKYGSVSAGHGSSSEPVKEGRGCER